MPDNDHISPSPNGQSGSAPGLASPFVGHVLRVVRTIPYRQPDYEEWSEDGGLIYECTDHHGDFLHVVGVDDPNSGEACWINLATVAEIRLECGCDCDDCDGDPDDDDGPPITFTTGDSTGDPTRN